MDVIIYLIFVCLHIVEDKYTSIVDSIEEKSKSIECEKNCIICESLRNDNIHYKGCIIRYFKTQCDTDNLNMGSVLLGDLEKVGWVVLEWAYEITNGSEQQEYFYHLNNHNFQKKMKYWNKINGTNREMLYGMENYNHDLKFCDVDDLKA